MHFAELDAKLFDSSETACLHPNTKTRPAWQATIAPTQLELQHELNRCFQQGFELRDEATSVQGDIGKLMKKVESLQDRMYEITMQMQGVEERKTVCSLTRPSFHRKIDRRQTIMRSLFGDASSSSSAAAVATPRPRSIVTRGTPATTNRQSSVLAARQEHGTAPTPNATDK